MNRLQLKQEAADDVGGLLFVMERSPFKSSVSLSEHAQGLFSVLKMKFSFPRKKICITIRTLD
ncbi:hypothetical protein B4094_1639 [Bacillus licheniformis]|nr:hypothetical protein BLDA23_00460 [Bacillus licheniformis]OLF94786.1 hypothetical protein B4094_1639 [Bacillus licheniformis]TWM36808.1 hypothetical protein CHCC14818_4336 [Bacillus licheniformis]